MIHVVTGVPDRDILEPTTEEVVFCVFKDICYNCLQDRLVAGMPVQFCEVNVEISSEKYHHSAGVMTDGCKDALYGRVFIWGQLAARYEPVVASRHYLEADNIRIMLLMALH